MAPKMKQIVILCWNKVDCIISDEIIPSCIEEATSSKVTHQGVLGSSHPAYAMLQDVNRQRQSSSTVTRMTAAPSLEFEDDEMEVKQVLAWP